MAAFLNDRPTTWFARAALAGAVVFVACLLARYDLCFQDPEVLTQDMYDRNHRARLLSYVGYIVNIETRLALWNVAPLHPSFTPFWIVTLVAAPVLLFAFLTRILQDRAGAMAGVAVYLASAGYLSGATMLFHVGKPLANVVVIAALYLCVRIEAAVGATRESARAPALPRHAWAALLVLLAVAPFTDETAAFAYAVPLVWCPSVFWPVGRPRPHAAWYARNWIAYLLAACAAAVTMVSILPALTGAAGQPVDLITYLRSMWDAGGGASRLDLRHLLWQTGNLLGPALAPLPATQPRGPVLDGPVVSVATLGLIAGALAMVASAVYAGRRFRDPLARLIISLGLFVPFQSLVLVFHEQELAATGFYYGAIASIIVASIAGVAFADGVRRRTAAAVTACAALCWILVVSAGNFLALNASWMAHANAKTLMLLPTIQLGAHGADAGPLQLAERRHLGRIDRWPERTAETEYSEDVTPAPTAYRFRDVAAIWRRWTAGDQQFLAGETLTLRNLWVAVELSIKAAGGPRWRRRLVHPIV